MTTQSVVFAENDFAVTVRGPWQYIRKSSRSVPTRSQISELTECKWRVSILLRTYSGKTSGSCASVPEQFQKRTPVNAQSL